MPLLRCFIYTLSVVSFLTFRLGGYDFLIPVLSGFSVIAIIISIPRAALSAKIFTLIFLGIGTWLVLQKGIGLYDYLLTFGDMLYLLSLFAMLPLLAIPIKIGGYDQAIEVLMGRKEKTPFQFYRFITSISFLLSSFLNLATLPIMYHSVKTFAKKIVKSNTDKFIVSSIIHGFTVAVTWTPFSGVVGVVLEITHVNWKHIFPILFSISLSALLLNWMIYVALVYWSKKKISAADQDENQPHLANSAAEETAASQSEADVKNPMHKILQIVGVIIVLILLIVTLNHILMTGIVVTATVIAAPFALAWALLLRKTGTFVKAVRTYAVNNIPGMAEQFAIFLSAGFFVKALHYSGYNHVANEYFLAFHHFVGGQLFLIILPLITLSFCFIGMHPIATITLLAESLNPSILGMTPEQMTIALIGGAVMTFMIGPFSGTMGVISSIIKVNPIQVVRWSIVQTIGFFLLLVLILLIY
jgi:hypothetical protein